MQKYVSALRVNTFFRFFQNASISACGSEAELRARLMAQYGAPLTSHHMSNYHNLPGKSQVAPCSWVKSPPTMRWRFNCFRAVYRLHKIFHEYSLD